MTDRDYIVSIACGLCFVITTVIAIFKLGGLLPWMTWFFVSLPAQVGLLALGINEAVKKAAEAAKKVIETRDSKEKTDDVLSRVYSTLRKDYKLPESKKKEELLPDPEQKGKQYITQSLSKLSKKDQKLVSRIYSILRAILPRDTADMVITKIQEELSK